MSSTIHCSECGTEFDASWRRTDMHDRWFSCPCCYATECRTCGEWYRPGDERVYPCQRCCGEPFVERNVGFVVACSNCYDGTPDSDRRNELGTGLTRADAFRSWNERMAEVA